MERKWKNSSFRCAFNVEALLFCFASVQIGARGAALMQTTVESAKLRMEQIAELAKTGGWLGAGFGCSG